MILMPEVRDQLKDAVVARRRPARRVVLGTGVALALVGGGGVAVSSSGILSSASPEPERPATDPPSVAAVSTFSALRDEQLKTRGAVRMAQLDRDQPIPPRRPGDPDDGHGDKQRPKGQGEAIIDSIGASKNGISLARTTAVADILIAAGSGGICLVTLGERGGGGSCHSERDTAAGRNVTTSGCLQQNDLFVAGIAPDGIEEVTVIARNGESSSADVVNNAYLVRVPPSTRPEGLPATVSWQAKGPAISAPAGVPGTGRC